MANFHKLTYEELALLVRCEESRVRTWASLAPNTSTRYYQEDVPALESLCAKGLLARVEWCKIMWILPDGEKTLREILNESRTTATS